jgi:alkylation response protein AidB-like acyl-CoA dehydrogenase
VGGFVRERVIPREQEIEQTDAIPGDLRAAAAELGLFGYALPEEFGGLGVTMAQDVRLAFEFGYTTPAFRSLFGTNNGIAGQVVAKFGSPEQKKAYLPALATGEAIASFALTESEAGSSPTGMRTSGRREGDGWLLSGTKRFITNAPLASWFVVFARTDSTAEGGRGISTFIVKTTDSGVSVGPRDHKMGQRGAWTSEATMGLGPVPAVAKLFDRTGLSFDGLALVELNEAFASQVLGVLQGWGWNDPDRLNVNGSGISLGHPIGATGARMMVTLLHELGRRGGGLGLETMCIGGGQGMAAVFEVPTSAATT